MLLYHHEGGLSTIIFKKNKNKTKKMLGVKLGVKTAAGR